jgi:hypothetical protein
VAAVRARKIRKNELSRRSSAVFALTQLTTPQNREAIRFVLRRPLVAIYHDDMISFVYSLDHGTTSQQAEMIQSSLEARFPRVRFIYGAEVIEGYENSIMPIAGEQDPTEPDRFILTPIPNNLAIELREVFQELVLEARTFRPS